MSGVQGLPFRALSQEPLEYELLDRTNLACFGAHRIPGPSNPVRRHHPRNPGSWAPGSGAPGLLAPGLLGPWAPGLLGPSAPGSWAPELLAPGLLDPGLLAPGLLAWLLGSWAGCIIRGSFWRSSRAPFGVVFGSIWRQFGVSFEPHWGQFGALLGDTKGVLGKSIRAPWPVMRFSSASQSWSDHNRDMVGWIWGRQPKI